MIPYYTEMDAIIERLRELGKMDYPQKRSYKKADGSWVTEDVPEYLEEQFLIARWKELQAYEKALDTSYCRNSLMVELRLDLIHAGFTREKYDPTLASRIAILVYTNKPAG